jgi:hypothetical protein
MGTDTPGRDAATATDWRAILARKLVEHQQGYAELSAGATHPDPTGGLEMWRRMAQPPASGDHELRLVDAPGERWVLRLAPDERAVDLNVALLGLTDLSVPAERETLAAVAVEVLMRLRGRPEAPTEELTGVAVVALRRPLNL